MGERVRLSEGVGGAAIDAGDGPVDGYLAAPGHGSAGPALIVLGPSLAADAGTVTTCERFAAEGFTAAAPDLVVPVGSERAVLGVNVPVLLQRLAGVVAALEGHPLVHGRGVGVLGSGDGGGHFALGLAAQRPDDVRALVLIDAPVLAEDVAASWAALKAPVEAHYGLAGMPDRRGELDRVEDAARHLKLSLDVFAYGAAAPGFFDETSPSHDADAAHEAFTRTLSFLRAHLG